MEKIFKIKNSNKLIRRGFTSLKDVKSFIKDNELFPEYGFDDISIEETTVKIHKVKSKSPPVLSEQNKIELINYLRQNGSNIMLDPHWSPIHHAFEEISNGVKNIRNLYLKDLVRRILEENFNLPKKEIEETFLKIKDYRIDYTKIVDKRKLSELIYNQILSDFNSNPEDFEFLKINTNYKPCSSISLYHKKSKMYFQIRPGDIVFTDWNVYGRNVNVTTTSNVSDKDIQEFKRKRIK